MAKMPILIQPQAEALVKKTKVEVTAVEAAEAAEAASSHRQSISIYELPDT